MHYTHYSLIFNARNLMSYLCMNVQVYDSDLYLFEIQHGNDIFLAMAFGMNYTPSHARYAEERS